ncbi:MAG TPA: hypothetical protein VFD82_21110 [Planctomycetota bacterium]|nr:hypothetical protein [Planctomycetota bacterium]
MTRTLFLSLLFSSSLCAQNAYCVDTNIDILYSLNLNTGAVTAIGSTLSGGIMATPADLCWRDDTNEIWTIDLSGGEAGTIDPATGLFTTVWNTGVSGWQAMAWDHTTKQFYCHNQSDQLHRLDPATGILTLVGTLASTTPLVTAIEIDSTGRLWAFDFAGSLFEIDKNTGLALPPTISTSPINNIQGVAIDAQGRWFGISTATDSLYSIDPTTGVHTLIGPNTGTNFVKGMVITGSAVQRGGIACPDGGGISRRMTWSGSSAAGQILNLGCDQGPVPSINLIIYGVTAFPQPLDLFILGAPGCLLYQSADVIAGGLPTGVELAFPIPSSPGVVGFSVFSQALIFDNSATPVPLGLVLSDNVKFTVTL